MNGNRIKELRKQKGLTQLQLAEKLGYTDRSSIAKLETNKNEIGYDKIVELCRVLDTTPEYLGFEVKASDYVYDIDISKTYKELNKQAKEMLLTYAKYLKDNQDK